RDGGGLADIAHGRVDRPAVRCKLGARPFEPVGAARADRHAGAGLGEGERDGAADAAAAGGDDDASSAEIQGHGNPLWFGEYSRGGPQPMPADRDMTIWKRMALGSNVTLAIELRERG